MIKDMYPYLVLDGNGKDAIAFYERAIGAEVLNMQLFKDMPANPQHPIPVELQDRVLNAHLKVGNINLMLSDTFPGHPYIIGTNITIALIIEDEIQTKDIFNKLQDGGEVLIPLQETFWTSLYGHVKDRFGVNWQVSTEQK